MKAAEKTDRLGRLLYGPDKRTLIVGILNRTPDSFSDGGLFFDFDSAMRHTENMINSGADIIDIGGESTRPGSRPVSVEEELDRVMPVLEGILENFDIAISVDTTKYQVAEEALKKGSDIINNCFGVKPDGMMADVIARYNAFEIIMHIKGAPTTMQKRPQYGDVLEEVKRSLLAAVEFAEKSGISPKKIIIDPGIGFGKTVRHNLIILNRLGELKEIGKPIMVGVSRKSFIGNILNKGVNERLQGTIAASAIAIERGADLIRVHDVREAKEAAKIVDSVLKEGLSG